MWQPIATAPKDRTVLAWLNTDRPALIEWRERLGRWWEPGLGDCTPIYWMPLPDPPLTDRKAGS